MKIPDANVLIYAVNRSAPQHAQARDWLDRSLGASESVAFAWVALLAFVRITTKVGLLPNPLSVSTALDVVDAWLAQPPAQTAVPGTRHAEILRRLLESAGTGGNLTSDAHLAALAIEHGAELWTFDNDFRRFSGLAVRTPGK